MSGESSYPTVTDEAALRELFPVPKERVILKQMTSLDVYCRRLIEISPFVCLATSDADGRVDVSPRGDAPGFVRVVDDVTLMIPDRRGNNRLDSLANIIANPEVGLLFMVPGINETVRVNGQASLITDQALCDSFTVNGKAPKVVIRITTHEVFFHCAKAFIRSKLWQPGSQVERGVLPGLGQIVAEQISGNKLSPSEVQKADAVIDNAYRNLLY
jgi:PPOX class probable FMN-dependent enzyme